MNRIILLFALMILSVTTISFADNPQQVITLKDGSQIVGELTGINNGVYTIKAPIIGDVHANANDVVSITNRNSAAAALPANNANYLPAPNQAQGPVPNMDQQIADQQKKLMANPQAMADLQQIAQDPQVMQALSDPALVQAVTNHDYAAVQNNPSVKKLMTNPNMQALIQKLSAQQHQQQQQSNSAQ